MIDRRVSTFLGLILAISLSWTAASAAEGSPGQTVDEPQEKPKSSGESSQTLKRLSIEELARISVVSVSRRSEAVSEAAAAVTIITGDAIRRAGIATLPDALRLALGVLVAREGQSWAISARGFQAAAANKMVVLVDGRSVYTPLFSGVFWESQDLILADIDRIEVIRGPGGTLWGANAVNGVINIITKLASDTQGALVQAGGGSNLGVIGLRYGGTAGANGHYRVYTKWRRFGDMPYEDGTDSHEPLSALQGGARLDLGPTSPTSFTLQGDVYGGFTDIATSADPIDIRGGNVLGRIRHTYSSGSQVQLQAYYDDTYRRVPGQYTERRHTGDVDLQYRLSAGARHDIVTGFGFNASHDRVTPTSVFFFEPAEKTKSLVNVYAQDEIALSPGKFSLILGSKFEHNPDSGFEYQPTARLRWVPVRGQTVWTAVSRAVRIPSRFDTDLRFTAGQPFVVLTGNPDFESETMVATEVGYRNVIIPKLAIGISAFVNSYDDLRSQEPTPPSGIPIVLDNLQNGRVSGLEIGAHAEFSPDWQLFGSYAYLHEGFDFDPGSLDPTGGSLEHNDPSHRVLLRSYADLPKRLSLDATLQWVSALPRPVVASYAELTLRVAHPINDRMDVEVIGDNLLHDRHVEYRNLGPVHAVPRSVFVRLTWRSR